jgi:aspartyl-tRNA(Asn)/glutamyl-tRNA(Gln) amidotransferase subunit C
MAKITKELLLKLAKLSHLAVTEQELDKLVHDIDAVLTYAACVGEVATEDVLSIEKNVNILREDVVIPTPPERILQAAPDRLDHYFVVPMILENNERDLKVKG